MNTATNVNFSFQLEELPKKLLSAASQVRTGSCRVQLSFNYKATQHSVWYLTLVQNRVVFSGTDPLSWSSFLSLLKRFIMPLRTNQSQKQIMKLVSEASPEEQDQIGSMIKKMEKAGLLTHEQVIQAIQYQLMADFDVYLLGSSGEAQLNHEPQLVFQAQLPGFKLEDLIARTKQRQKEWEAIKTRIPSLKCSPVLNTEEMAGSSLAVAQKHQIQLLVSSGQTLEEIAYKMAKDPLEIAKVFSKLVRSHLVSLEPPCDQVFPDWTPEIFIVDDSPLIVQQFKTLVSSWGYRVRTCQNPLLAVEQMLSSKPAMIFVDINMPGLSGFDLIKKIRRQPEIASIPLVLLTAENSLSNQWRAQWASCQFLAKPRSRDEVSQFRTELRQLLPDVTALAEDADI